MHRCSMCEAAVRKSPMTVCKSSTARPKIGIIEPLRHNAHSDATQSDDQAAANIWMTQKRKTEEMVVR